MTDARALARTMAAAARLTQPVNAMVRSSEGLGLTIERQAVAVIEELDLLRHFLHIALLDAAIGRAGPLPPLAIPPEGQAFIDAAAATPTPSPQPSIAPDAINRGQPGSDGTATEAATGARSRRRNALK